jgi:Glycosyl transferase family 2
MRVVVSHFFNEAYLLPWWLRHHREVFDHGVLIDRYSTDGSVDICRELVPSWEVVRSETAQFSAIMCDFEVMKHEARFPDAWKIALTTTEFLVACRLSEVEQFVTSRDLTAVRVPRAIMVDTEPDRAPDPDVPLTEQKYCGIWEAEHDYNAAGLVSPGRPAPIRIYHRYMIGAYAPGRHVSHLPGQCEGNREQAAIWKYAFSPWTEAFKARKLQINATRSDFDKAHRFGYQHEADLPELEHRWAALRAASGPLFPRTSHAQGRSAAAPAPTEHSDGRPSTPMDAESSKKPPRGWPRRLLHGVKKRFPSLAGLAATYSSKS